jgi:sugar phosphate isomerase/epimerase
VHPRVSLSAISTFQWSLDEDLAFYERAGITAIGASLAKLEAAGIEDGARRLRDAGVRVSNLIGIGPFHLDDPSQWQGQRDRVRRAVDAAAAVQAECMILTTGPAGSLTWEEAADALTEALTPVIADAHARGIPFGLEHTNSLRVDVGFVHTLADVVDLARRLGIGVCVETNACWAERGLGTTIATGVDAFRIVQVSDFAIGTLSTPNRLVPGDGDIPLERILGQVLAAGYAGCFDLELIGPRIDEEGYEAACSRAVVALGDLLERLGVDPDPEKSLGIRPSGNRPLPPCVFPA